MGIQLLRTDDCVSQVIGRHGDMVYRLCVVYLKNKADAEDAFQDIFLKLFEKCPTFNDEEHLKAWLIRCTINHCKNVLGSFWHKNRTVISDALASVTKGDDREIIEYVMQLPVTYRSVIYLHYFEGYPTKEIAAMLKTKDATVRTRLRRGRELLKANMVKGGFEYGTKA
jgi:RNA polymerase sigma factor (sigma-70 family)